MTEPAFPDGLDDAHADTRGGLIGHVSLWSLMVLGALMALALTGRLGGARAAWIADETPSARLAVHNPRTLRNGIFFETRIRIDARRAIAEPVIAIPPDLWRDMTVNTEFPDPKEQVYRDGAFRFTYDALPAGGVLELKFDGQINPPLTIGTAGTVTLLDGDRPLAAVPVRMTVLP